MSNKIGRNKEWCKGYKSRNQEKTNFQRKHRKLAKILSKKANKLFANGDNVERLNREIQRHESFAQGY